MTAVARHDICHRIAKCGYDPHGKYKQRKGHDGIGDAADDAVGPAAEKAGRDAGESTHDKYQQHGKQGDGEIEPCGYDDAAEDIAAELIGAEPMMRRWRL